MRQWMLGLALSLLAGSAIAEPQCTSESKDKWLGESDMKAKVMALGYKIKVFKVTKGNCYEVYGADAKGKRVEIYYHPITGKAVEEH